MSERVATVNGVPIGTKDLGAAMQAIAREQFRTSLHEVPESEHQKLREMALERLIARELIYQAALAKGIVASKDDIIAEKARILKMAGNPKDFWVRLAERGMDEMAFERMVRKDVTVDLMNAQMLENVPEPSSKEIEQFFRQYPEKLRLPERVKISHILIKEDPQSFGRAFQKASEIKDLAKTTDFDALAKQYSECPSAALGGNLGFVRREDLDDTFADAVFLQGAGELVGPIRTAHGVHLAKVWEKDDPGPPTLEEARPTIIHVLKRMAGTRLLNQWVNELRQSAEVKLF